jgi:hypothetical protein
MIALSDGSAFECAVVWSDPDLLELEARVRFGGWSGHERAYVGRDELVAFADALDGLVEASAEDALHATALLRAGQPNLSWVTLRVSAYDHGRRLSMHVALGRADAVLKLPNERRRGTSLRMNVPLEREAAARLAAALRGMARTDAGAARVDLPSAWP